MDAGKQSTETEVIVGGPVTATVADPDLVESCVDVAVMVAIPAAVGVKTPDELIVPPVAAQATAELNAPVPCTLAVQVGVCVVRMAFAEQVTETDVIEGDAFTITEADPDLVESWVDVAVMVAIPSAIGVKTPDELIGPPVAAQVTLVLKLPDPETVAVHWLVCPVWGPTGVQETLTDLIACDSVSARKLDAVVTPHPAR
jgi:methylglyoxal synthase